MKSKYHHFFSFLNYSLSFHPTSSSYRMYSAHIKLRSGFGEKERRQLIPIRENAVKEFIDSKKIFKESKPVAN